MSRLAARLTGSLFLLLLAGSMAWSEPTAPASATSPAPAPPVPAATDTPGNPAAPTPSAGKSDYLLPLLYRNGYPLSPLSPRALL